MLNTVLAVCMIIFTNNKPYSGEILRHERAHIACPWWHHPKGFNPKTNKAWEPPAQCVRTKSSCDEIGVPQSEAIERCNGFLGTHSELQYGCSGRY